MSQTLPREPWRESEEDWGKRLKDAVAYINDKHDIDSLCREMPNRMRQLAHDAKGNRLREIGFMLGPMQLRCV